MASREICCDDCNNAIAPLEATLRDALARAFAAVGAVNDEREPFAVRVEYEGREFVLADGDAVLQVGGVRFDASTRSIVVPLPAGLDAQAEKLAKALWSHGWGPDDVGKLGLTPGDPDPVLPVGPTANEFDLKIGTHVEHHRVLVKMALELLAYHRHDLAMRGELSEARRFARRGEGSFRGKPDSRSDGSGLVPKTGLPDVYNAIEVWSCGRTVFFRVVFLGPLVFTGTLTTEWTGDAFRVVYAFDGRDPRQQIASGVEFADGPNLAVWFGDLKEETTEDARARIEALSLALAKSKPRVEREAPPDIEVLRAAVRAKLAAMPPSKKRKSTR